MAAQTSQSRAPHAWAGLRPPPRSGRALPLAVALRDRRWLTLHRQHSTSPFAHTRAHDIRSIRAHKHTCTLTRRSLSSRHSVTQRGHAWMDAHAPHRHAAGWRQVSRRTLQSNPFLLPFFSNFQVSSKSCVTARPLLSATPCVRHLDTMNLPQPLGRHRGVSVGVDAPSH